MSSKAKKQSSLEKRLEAPLPLSVWWYLAAVFLLFFGIFVFGLRFLAAFVDSKGGQWSIFTIKRPHLTPYSGPQDVRWGIFYIPVIALNKLLSFAPIALLLGIVMLLLRFVMLKHFLNKHTQKQ